MKNPMNWFKGQRSVHGLIVEFAWNRARNQWKLVRIRGDKRLPNHRDVASEIMKSIKDGVDLEVVSLQETTATLSSLALGPRIPDSYCHGRIVGVQLGKLEKLGLCHGSQKSACAPCLLQERQMTMINHYQIRTA